jgi:DNA segregation ATPase FtsK/SpoIIIE, S-DNA-T family
MAKTATKDSKNKSGETDLKKGFVFNKRYKLLFGILLVIIAVALFFSFVSYYINWQEDQSAVNVLGDRKANVKNWLGKIGATISHFFLFKGFGIASFLFVRLLFITGIYMILELSLKKLKSTWFWDLFALVNISLLFGFFADSIPELGGVIGYEMNLYFQDFMGNIGTLLILVFSCMIYLILKININPDKIKRLFQFKMPEVFASKTSDEPSVAPEENISEVALKNEIENETASPLSQFEINKEALKPTIENSSVINLDTKKSEAKENTGKTNIYF